MKDLLTKSEKDTAIKEYSCRKKTIMQLACKYGVTYETMRRVMVNAGYSNGLKVRWDFDMYPESWTHIMN